MSKRREVAVTAARAVAVTVTASGNHGQVRSCLVVIIEQFNSTPRFLVCLSASFIICLSFIECHLNVRTFHIDSIQYSCTSLGVELVFTHLSLISATIDAVIVAPLRIHPKHMPRYPRFHQILRQAGRAVGLCTSSCSPGTGSPHMMRHTRPRRTDGSSMSIFRT